MSKKLISLVLVLAIAGMASAAANTVYWNRTVASGDMSTLADWTTSTSVVTAPTFVDGTTSCVINGNVTYGGALSSYTMKLAGSQSVSQLKWAAVNDGVSVTVNVGSISNSSAVLTTTGLNASNNVTIATNLYANNAAPTSSTVNVYGTFNVAFGVGMGATMYAGSSNTIDVYNGGLLDAHNGGGTSYLALGSSGSGVVAGDIKVNIRGGGVVFADSLKWGTFGGTKKIVLWGASRLFLNGTIPGTAVIVDGAGNTLTGESVTISGLTGNASVLNGRTATMYSVPEPATVALLGLGCLLLRRKK